MKTQKFVLIAAAILIGLTQVQSETANALHFDSVDDAINCGNSTSIQITGSIITLEVIIKFNAFRDNVWQGNIINKGASGPYSGYMLRAGDDGKLNFNIGNGSWNELNTNSNTVSTDVWCHIVATYHRNYMKIYLDGVEVASRHVVGVNIYDNSANLTISNWSQSGDRHVNATIDEIRVWNITRTPAEIAANTSSELTTPQTGLVLYYKFNQGVPGGNNTNETNAIDETGNNNGTLSNFTLNGVTSNWVMESTLPIPEHNNNTALDLFPNPATSNIQVKGLQHTEN
ncbi:MAG: LamG domain-containing protein [Flavobacteriaceae bacterium]|nr:LamG domain-containing protein [Flavobacteriaceae bacterium]